MLLFVWFDENAKWNYLNKSACEPVRLKSIIIFIKDYVV